MSGEGKAEGKAAKWTHVCIVDKEHPPTGSWLCYSLEEKEA